MLKELFDTIVEHCTKNAMIQPKPLDPSLQVKKDVVLYWNPESGKVDSVDKSLTDARHNLLSLESLISYTESHSEDTNVWVGDSSVVVEVVEHSERDVVRMQLNYTPLFNRLRTLRGNPSVLQADAIRLLRQDFAPFDVSQKALTVARNLKIATVEDYESEQTNTTARLGKSVVSTASGATDLPEYLDVKTQVYLSSGVVAYPIRVWMSVDTNKRGVLLFEPDAAAMEEAQLLARSEIFGSLVTAFKDNNQVRVYEGEYCVS